jgi:ferric-dicitrate binding protein FerR (iron transport regulator)
LLLQKEPRQINITAQKKQPPASDRAPGANKAFLQLADGSTITLDDSATGMLAQQGATKILKLNNGQLQYNSSTQVNAPILYNTISTPRGGQYHVILPDGSKVWLNAASSLRFPTAFQGNTRMVQLTGEAYFEVVHNSKMPFKVSVPPPPGETGGAEVEVLGTHFNVMGYDNENTISTTLLEGSVRVSQQAADKGSPVLQLKAGQQANLHKGSSECKVQEVDTDAVVAWKNGMFQFNSADIQTIMRQIERWYDVEVTYKGRIPDGHYSGIVPRDNNLLKVLRIFEESDLKFTIEGKKLSVL